MHRPAALALVVLGALAAGSASAQDRPPLGQFNILRYYPSPGPNNYFGVDGAATRGELEPAMGLQLDYAHEPFTLYEARCDGPDGSNCETTGTASQIARYTAAAHLWASMVLFHHLQIGVIVPLAITEGDTFSSPPMMGRMPQTYLTGGFAFALADPRLHIKGNFFDDRSTGLRLGASGWVSAPVAQQIAGPQQVGRFLGDEQPSFGLNAIVEIVNSGFHGAANLGFTWRDGDRLFSTVAGPQFTYGVGVGYEITPLVMVLGEVVGATSFSSEVDENPLEGRLGGRLRVDDLQIDLAGGAGIVSGVGVPVFRIVGGLSWAPQRSDEDGDGINDDVDACPAEREDVDGWHDEDGCPEPDNDDDGLLDEVDRCPDEAEDLDNEEDEDGCPDLDNDGDGIHDGYDSCPTQPEDMDGDRDDDGCPDNDRDRDHIEDDVDHCPDEPEDTDGYGDEDGCPDVDFDGDGLPDEGDQCPDQAEDLDGFEDEDGCPEEGTAMRGRPGDADGDGVRDSHDGCQGPQEDMDGFQDGDGCPDPDNDGDGVLDADDQCPIEAGPAEERGCPVRVRLDLEHGTIMLMSQVEFATGRDRILDRSFPMLEQLHQVLVSHPEILRVRIEGHTDDRGPDARNMTLSRRRAASVRRWLVEHGVAPERLEAFGCGELHPVGPNDTDAGRQANRRVVFLILDPAISGLEVAADCQAAD